MGIYLTTVPFCFALIIGILYIIGLLFLNSQSGALNLGVDLLGLILSFVSFVVAIFAVVLKELLTSMFVIKKENELTV